MKVKVEIEKIAGKWAVKFSIGMQTFHLQNFSGLKTDAMYHKKMLEKAFDSMINSSFTVLNSCDAIGVITMMKCNYCQKILADYEANNHTCLLSDEAIQLKLP